MTIEQLTYAGTGCTMVCLVDDEMLDKYRRHEDGITPGHVVDSYDIFKYESGKQGTMMRPSKAELSSTFGTDNKESVIEFMLEKGQLPVRRTKKNTGGGEDDKKHNPRFHVERSGRPL